MNQQVSHKEKSYRKGVGFDDLFPVPLSMDDGASRRDQLETAISRIELDMREHGREDRGWHRQASKALWIKGEQLKLINRWLVEQGGFLRNLYEHVERWAARVKPNTPVVRSIEIEKDRDYGTIVISLYDPTQEYSDEGVAMNWREFQEAILNNQPIFN